MIKNSKKSRGSYVVHQTMAGSMGKEVAKEVNKITRNYGDLVVLGVFALMGSMFYAVAGVMGAVAVALMASVFVSYHIYTMVEQNTFTYKYIVRPIGVVTLGALSFIVTHALLKPGAYMIGYGS